MDIWKRESRSARPIGSWRTCFIVIVPFALLLLYGLLVPNIRSGPAIRRDNAQERMRRIAIALMEYEQSYKSFPPAYTVDAAGNKLHCWRTFILPYLDEGPLYTKIDLTKPWDAPENAVARAASVLDYEPYDFKLPSGQTLHHVINDPQGMFDGPQPTESSDISDQQTVMVIQAAKTQAAHWLQPDEYSLNDLLRIDATNASGTQGQTYVALADGSVHQLRLQDLTPEQITGLITITGNEPPIPASLFSQPTAKNR